MLYITALKGVIFACFLGLLSSYLLLGQYDVSPEEQEVIHRITVFHPGMKQAKDCRLVERKEDSGHTIDYRMGVESVICLNGLCKVVEVRLMWDKFGHYHGYKLAEGVELEKKDGTPFTAADYDKLHQILKDEHSVFRAFELGQIVDLSIDSSGIDGISGATILTDESASVKGAAWTCYTLWHWANGDMRDTMIAITGRSFSTPDLLSLLNKDALSISLALAELEKRGCYDEATVGAIASGIQDWKMKSVKQGINYLEKGPPEIFFPSIRRILPSAGPRQRVLFLESVMDGSKHTQEAVLGELPFYVPQLASFQEINLLLNYLERKQISNHQLNEQLLSHLETDDFILARRVYWFLSAQRHSPEVVKKLEEFGQKYSGRL